MSNLKVIRGTFDECFSHFREANKAGQFTVPTFFSGHASKFKRWLRNTRSPAGESKIRMRIYLETLGYKFQETEDMHEAVISACRILAYGLATVGTIAEGFGCEDPGKKDKIFRILHGTRRARLDQLHKAEQFVAVYADRLHTAHGIQDAGTIAPNPNSLESPNDAVITSVVGMLTAVLPLLRLINSDRFTAAERKRLRDGLGFYGPMNISTEFNRLCGERARGQFNNMKGNVS